MEDTLAFFEARLDAGEVDWRTWRKSDASAFVEQVWVCDQSDKRTRTDALCRAISIAREWLRDPSGRPPLSCADEVYADLDNFYREGTIAPLILAFEKGFQGEASLAAMHRLCYFLLAYKSHTLLAYIFAQRYMHPPWSSSLYTGIATAFRTRKCICSSEMDSWISRGIDPQEQETWHASLIRISDKFKRAPVRSTRLRGLPT